MNYSPGNILRYLCVQNGLCSLPETQTAWPAYADFIPDEGANAILFTNTTARKDGRYMRTGETIIHPGVQILFRGRTQDEAYNKGKEISIFLDSVKRQQVLITTETYRIDGVHKQGDLVPLSMEEHYKALERQIKENKRNRFIYVLNVIMTVTGYEVSEMMTPQY